MIIPMPVGLLCGQFAIGQHRYDLTEMSDSTGATATRIMGPPRWSLSIAAPSNGISLPGASAWEGMLLKLRGGINHLSAFDIVRLAPRGTARGAMVLNGAHVAGANLVSIAGSTPNGTLLVGDWLQIGSGLGGQLVKIVTDALANGAGVFASIEVEPPLRKAWAAATPVTWDKPLGHYKLTTDSPAWAYNPESNALTGYAMDLIEQWA